MRKSFLASAVMLICSFAAMAFSPSGQGEKTMSPFKFKAEQPQKISRQFHLNSDIVQKQFTKKGMLVYNSFEDFTNEEFNANSIKAPTKENEETYTITVNLIYDKEEIEKVYSGIAFSNLIENLRYSSNRTPDLTPDKIEYTVPAGNYDIEVKLRTINMDVIILTATEVNVNNDLELTLDTADADVEINWNALMPDGKVPCNDTPVYDPKTFELLEVIPGNVWMQHNDLIVYNEKHEYDDIMSFNPETLIIGDVNLVIGQGNIKTMPNNNYTFHLEKKAISTEGGYIIPLMARANNSVTVTNNINNYVTLKPTFTTTPHKADPIINGEVGNQTVMEFDPDKAFLLNYASIINGKMTGAFTSAVVNGSEKIQKWIHVCQDPTLANVYQIMPVPSLLEDWEFNYPVKTLPIELTQSDPSVIAINNIAEFNGYLHLPNDKNIYMTQVANPWLSFNINKPHVWNYGCPTLVFSSINLEWGNIFNFTYIGRLSENRRIDLFSTEISVAVDDLPPSEEVLENLQYGQLPESGKIDLEFIDTNVAIDGIPGKNIARIGFDLSRKDWEPPTLQIVRFVDTDDNFIDRYATGEDGVIEFYGGDFAFHANMETIVDWYTEEPAAEVKVEYAPYGTDSFLPLEVENIPERDFMPGFGTYYRGSLAAVDRKSENGWFDVRITLTDAAGNFQEQTLSPAFKIDSSVGVETITSPEIAVSVTNGNITVCGCESPLIEVYTPDGILLSQAASSNINVTEFAHGIYLINVIDGTRRVLRKIHI